MIKPIKIAILGCNHGHARAYYGLCRSPYYEVVGASIAHGYRNNVGLEPFPEIKQYDSDEELYAEHPDVEAVVIASDNASHYEQFKEACRRKLHIFSMKIPTFNMEEYEDMIKMADEAGVVCKIELEMREHAELMRVKDLIDSGEIGDVLSITMLNFSHNPVWWRAWQANPEASYGKRVPLFKGADRFRGGALADHPHIFDAVRYVLDDDFDEMFADVGPNIRDTEIDEMIPIIGKTKKGVVVSLDPSYANIEQKVVRMDRINNNWQKYPKTVEVSMTVHGTKGSIIAELYSLNTYQNGGKDNIYMLGSCGRKYGVGSLTMQFYHAVRDGDLPTVGIKQHYNSVAAMNAAYESITEGKAVKVKNKNF